MGILADGVSECANGKRGADIACRTVAELFEACGELFFRATPEKTAYLVLSEVLGKLSEAAKAANESVRSYSATLAFACLDKKTQQLLTFQLGDSCILTLSPSGVRKLHPEYETAFTTTAGAEDYVRIKLTDATREKCILLCSDGAWKPIQNGAALVGYASLPAEKGRKTALDAYFDGLCAEDDCSCLLMDL